MNTPVRIILILSVLGFGLGIISGGDLGSININNISTKAEQFLNTTDFGPLNEPIQNIREAFVFFKQEVNKAMDATQKK